MKNTIYLILIFLCCYNIGQSQISITGKVIDEGLVELPGVNIYDKDTIRLATTGWEGKFEIKVSENTKELIFAGIGTEWKKISIPYNCYFLEVIMLNDGTYDYTSSGKIDRLRKERFNKIPGFHRNAIQKGIFREEPCFEEEFSPIKPQLDKIAEEDKKLRKRIKTEFKRLEIGDTIQIPFNGSFRADGTDRTSLYVFSNVVENTDFDCVIEGILLNKNRSKDYLLTIEIIDTSKCDYNSIIYHDEELKIGDRILHRMKYYKVLIQ